MGTRIIQPAVTQDYCDLCLKDPSLLKTVGGKIHKGYSLNGFILDICDDDVSFFTVQFPLVKISATAQTINATIG